MPMIKHGIGTLGDGYTIRTNPDGKKVAVFDNPIPNSPKEVVIGENTTNAEDDDNDHK